MRRSLAALALALALPAAAQTGGASPDGRSPDEPGVFAEVGVAGGYSSSSGELGFSAVSVGYRTESGLSLGLHGKALRNGIDHESIGIGPEVRLGRALDDRTRLDLYASGTLGLYRGAALDADAFRMTGVGTQVGALATRRYDLGRGLTLAATGGLSGSLGQRFAYEAGGVDGGVDARASVVLGAQVEFNAFGAKVAIGPSIGVPIIRTPGTLGLGAGIHNTGGGPLNGFLTIRF